MNIVSRNNAGRDEERVRSPRQRGERRKRLDWRRVFFSEADFVEIDYLPYICCLNLGVVIYLEVYSSSGIQVRGFCVWVCDVGGGLVVGLYVQR